MAGERRLFQVAIALGSNLGDRQRHLDSAIQLLARDLLDLNTSTFIDTEPVGVEPGQPRYLNAAVVGMTSLSPQDLLQRLLSIEKAQGRARPYPLAPRTLDLDLILYGECIVEQEGLAVPHPRFRERVFVLAPLAEIAPDLIDPVTGKSIRALLQELLET